jgi:hypothetical protein
MIPGGAEVGSASLPTRSLRRPHSDDNVPQQVLDPCSGGRKWRRSSAGPHTGRRSGEVSAFHNDRQRPFAVKRDCA